MNNVVLIWLTYIFTVVVVKAIVLGLVLWFIWMIYTGNLVSILP